MIPMTSNFSLIRQRALVLVTLLLTACGQLPIASTPGSVVPAPAPAPMPQTKGNDVVIFALSLLETGYRFGGKNPEAGLDCSGMVSYVFDQAAGVKLKGSAADLARLGRPVTKTSLRPGDLLFFNTRNHPHSHVAIYIGEDRFVHAPSTKGKVKVESLDKSWFASRFEEARTYFD